MSDALKMAVLKHLRAHDPETMSVAQVVNLVIDTYKDLHEAEQREGFTPAGMRDTVKVRASAETRHWTQVTIKSVGLRGGGPYQDTVDIYEATFNGGHPSNEPGYELPFGVPSAFNPERFKDTMSFPPKTVDEREADHYANIKKRIRGMVPGHGWEVDLTAGEPNRMGATVLEKFEFVTRTAFTSTFRLTIRKPNMS